ncbi:synaptonemal complex protein 1 [Echeneis naucrates]|uniref:synaptonemal complex protein 1 n=1 Tax=Echeneis naucrates TaxID=173247 RepID=UPI0011145EBE|nr:synaptonemal complex protein 1 [Echeneis naucrates]
MDREGGFNFKLLVPPRVNIGQTSAVRPQETVEKCGGFMSASQQGYSRRSDKGQNAPYSNTSMVTPTIPTRHDFAKMKVVPPMEKDTENSNPAQLCSKLFDEVEKIKFWKVKVDSDIALKERGLQDNKRTIETQRKAIQELQFENESLSIKLEEQISENEDLRNKNNATRNLCNILKDTFQRSAEKMQLFESEREETQQLLMENSETIQKLIAGFESLRIQAEADQQETRKMKEGLLQFEELKEKYYQEYNTKEEEVRGLQIKLKMKENELQKIVLDFNETQKHCKELQEVTNQQYELLQSSKAEEKSLLLKVHIAEQSHEKTQKNYEAIAAALEKSKEENAQILQSRDLSLQELNAVKKQHAEMSEQIQTTIDELQNSLTLEIQRAKDLEDELMANKKELQSGKILWRDTVEQSAEKDGQIKVLKDELDIQVKSIVALKGKIDVTDVSVEELTAKLSRKSEEVNKYKSEAEMASAENNLLKKAFEDLKEKSTMTEIQVQDLEGQLFTEIKKNKEHTFKLEELRRDITLHKVQYEELRSEKMAIQQQFESGPSNVKAIDADMKNNQVSEEKAVQLKEEIQRLKEENQCLQEEVNATKTKSQVDSEETVALRKKIEENCKHLLEKITEKEKQIKSIETKLSNLRKTFEMKLKTQKEYQKENKILKKQITKEIAKSTQLENDINRSHDESQNLKKLNDEVHQKLLKDLECKRACAAQLENEVQELRLTAAEATKNKEDAELKCQQKIADMVALMEKHKSQYDRMVEEKDAELTEKKKKVNEAVANGQSLELDLSKYKTENDQLKNQLKTETSKKMNLLKELSCLKKEMCSMKSTQLSATESKQSPALDYKDGGYSVTQKGSVSKRHIFEFSKTMKAPSSNKDNRSVGVLKNIESDTEPIGTSCGSTPKTKEVHTTEELKTPNMTNRRSRVAGTSKIKSYRIRTPPSAKKAALGKSTIEFDPKSDSSDQNDLLTFANAPTSNFSISLSKLDTFKKIQSPVTHKSPGNTLKLAAMKRMRDAGWTAVTGCDKKKKNNEKIFA